MLEWGRTAIALVVVVFPAAHARPLSYGRDIAPIIYRRCAACHRPGEAGPFPLLTYTDVKKRARLIAEVTASRYMPPWLPQPGYGDFADERRLSDDEIDRIAEWVKQGAPEGQAGEVPAPPHFTEGWQLGPPDMILETQRPFTVPADGPDVFWNFIFTPPVTSTRYVRAVEIRVGDRRLVHHANLYVDRARTARRQEIAPGAGFPGMDPLIEHNAFDPGEGHFLFWKPGSVPSVEPDGMAWRLDPGTDLVLNAHMHPSGRPETARPSIGLYFTDKAPDRYPELMQLEHDGALRIPPGDAAFAVSDGFRLPLDVDVLAIYPHAHYLGKVLEAWATLPDGSRRWLIRIPDWDLNWQAVYRYRKPVFLPKGSVVAMRFQYDNSEANPRNPNHPPKLVESGNQSTDEMGHLWLQVLPRGLRDRRRELAEALARHRLEKYPDDADAHLELGTLLLARLDAPDAVAVLERAADLAPQNAEAQNLLGSALAIVGRSAEAIARFRRALELEPDYVNARFNLANALLKSRQLDEAIENYRQVTAALPNDRLAKQRLARALALRDRRAAGRASQ
jgi:Tfp pilus assembly protein PilF